MENYVNKRIDNRYEVLEIIGVGGMAVVYKAYDRIDDRTVAIKILKEEYLANEEFRRRFKNESKYIAVLSHPNIVKVYDMSFGDRLQYIVMEFIEGITLKEYIEQQKVIQPKEAVHFVTQILRALQHAHDKGIVHRDVKPQNIMLLQNGSIKVTDFGIASFSRSETATIAESSAIGSVHYISPEQARGDTTDAKADIYSVGVLMYEMLTGNLPFKADNPISVVMMHMNEEAANMREINGNIPVGLEQITMHAMQKEPRARYQSAAEMLLDLDEFKRNPAIKFDYSYFVDNEPTKYIDRTMNIKTDSELKQSLKTKGGADSLQNRKLYEAEPSKGNTKVMPILTGVSIGLVAILVVVLAVLALFTDVFGGKTNKNEVPNFISMNYEKEIKGNKDYNHLKIIVEYEVNTQYDYGVVIKQTPEKGEKVPKNKEIHLVVNENRSASIVDVYGQSYQSAKQTLESNGFKTQYEMVFNTSISEGSVISTKPERGKTAPEGSVVIIYVATHTDEDAVFVPDVLGFTPEEATELINSVGLVVGQILPKDTIDKPGKVVEQVPAATEKLHPGDKVDIYVSTGKAPTVTTELTIQLPDKSNQSGTLRVYLNGIGVDSLATDVLLSGSTHKFMISGSGQADSLIVKVDGADIYSCTINFTTNPITVTDEKTINDAYADSFYGGGASTIPSVVGKAESEALRILKDKGFRNITVKDSIVSDSSDIGKVIDQNPHPRGIDIINLYDKSTSITLYVGRAN